MSVTFSAPASSANLGPCFDCAALALDLRCTVTVAPAPDWEVTSSGAPAGPDVRGPMIGIVHAAVPQAGPMRMGIDTEIPQARGLGSSAALIAATVAAVTVLTGEPRDPDDVFATAARIEGHPDNVAAAIYGGLVTVAPGGSVRSMPLHSSLVPLLAVPDATLSTEEARRALPQVTPLRAAARSVARAVFLFEGLRTGSREAFLQAAGDELHETHRASLSPVTVRLVQAARGAGALHASWSGAGPSVLALVTEAEKEAVSAALAEVLDEVGGRVMAPGIAELGITLHE